MDLNELIAGAAMGTGVMLPSGEFEGPVVINKPLKVTGHNTTIWARNGAAVKVCSNGVSLEDLRVEITDGRTCDIAVETDFLTVVKNVEVLGSVRGFSSADGKFDVPKTIALGEFSADAENSWRLTVNVPEQTEIRCFAREVRFSPEVLKKGENELTVYVSGIPAQTFLYAEILFASTFTRRIYLTGKASQTAEKANLRTIFTHEQREPSDVICLTAAKAPEKSDKIVLQKGQRTALFPYVGSRFSVYFSCVKKGNADIDPYVFLLDKDGRAFGDGSLIFFGKERSDCGGVRYFQNDGHIEIDLSAVDYRVEKITLAYAVYAADSMNNFSAVSSPKISICTDTERISFVMDELMSESCAVAAEFYLYKGEWKISAVGAGYISGIAKLCNSFGIDVE